MKPASPSPALRNDSPAFAAAHKIAENLDVLLPDYVLLLNWSRKETC
jgi:hypothetical protein